MLRRSSRAAFTMVELLVVIGIICLLFAMVLPAIQRIRESANRLLCQSNMGQIALALHSYHTDNHRLPPLPSRNAQDPNKALSWMALILPYIEEDKLYSEAVQACRINPDGTKNPPHRGFSTVIKTYVCATDGRLYTPLTDANKVTAAFTSYIGIGGTYVQGAKRGVLGVLGDNPGGSFAAISDGLTNTLMFGERPPPDSLQAGWWYPSLWIDGKYNLGPNGMLILGAMDEWAENEKCGHVRLFAPGKLSNPCDRFQLWSLHPGGANFAFADATVRFLDYSYESVILSLGSKNGGEVVEIP